jgi:hypothetical protein
MTHKPASQISRLADFACFFPERYTYIDMRETGNLDLS